MGCCCWDGSGRGKIQKQLFAGEGTDIYITAAINKHSETILQHPGLDFTEDIASIVAQRRCSPKAWLGTGILEVHIILQIDQDTPKNL